MCYNKYMVIQTSQHSEHLLHALAERFQVRTALVSPALTLAPLASFHGPDLDLHSLYLRGGFKIHRLQYDRTFHNI